MRELEPAFELSLNETILRISEHELAGKRVFHVNFGAGVKPLIITVGLSVRNEKFWTSIPEGRQKEAQQIGKMIAEHIRAKRR
ncbi:MULTISPECIES: hypothetical protein [unclassified Pedobacter]|uniref:hypothetical protein n=1 Tax=unclassified Pedobacter TaxID=2628915 RepID=UPI001DB5B0DD|nr:MULTISPECIES: hypothetical protein [unclassified Pedobacter]CAH0266102.1 hypothetical protein SRABI36_03601 [Pedobacter sp. Bi36]CAH0292416.1 hypothetical protein SRABI126_04095 [Pedobacter sp. Bi126]